MSETKDTKAGSTPTTTTTEAPAQQQTAAQAEAQERQAKADHKPTKAQREYLASGTAPAVQITPTTFGDGKDDQPPGGHPQDPTSKDSVGSKAEL